MNGLRLLLVNGHGADEFSGGAERYVAQLADGFAARGAEVEVLAAFPSEERGRKVTTLHESDWRSSQVRRAKNRLGDVISMPGPRLREAVARARPDLVHTNNLPGISTAVWESARRQGAPVVHTLHDYYLLCARVTLLRPDGEPCRPHPLLCGVRARRLGRWAGAVSNVIGVSQHLLDRHAGFFPHAQRRVIRLLVSPREVDVAPPRERLSTLGYLGTLERTKGVDRLLEAAPELAALGVSLSLAGMGRLRGDVEAAARREPNVDYHGPLADEKRDRFFEECDAGIVPSVWEEPGAPSLTVLEWLAASRPVLVSPRGGVAEVLPELRGAIAVQPDASGIVHAVEDLLSPERWREARDSVEPPASGRTFEGWLDEHALVYRDALGAAG
jgi:glycosyltransferase involved in cell wall biosynthesis